MFKHLDYESVFNRFLICESNGTCFLQVVDTFSKYCVCTSLSQSLAAPHAATLGAELLLLQYLLSTHQATSQEAIIKQQWLVVTQWPS